MKELVYADNIAFYETGDGSNTLINKNTNETYHSKAGAVQESMHVFIKHGLEYVLSSGHRPLNILEVGFGTGLNALLTADYNCIEPMQYHALEPYLVPFEILSRTNYTKYLQQKHLKDYLVSQYEKQTQMNLNPLVIYLGNCEVKIFNTSLQAFQAPVAYDLVYYDAFSKQHEKELWHEANLHKAFDLLAPGGVFVTYAATGDLKRAMKAVHAKVELLPGAPGKREMVRATKPNN